MCRHSASPQGEGSPLHVPVYQREGSPALAALAKNRSSKQTSWKQARPQYKVMQPRSTQPINFQGRAHGAFDMIAKNIFKVIAVLAHFHRNLTCEKSHLQLACCPVATS